MDALDKKVIELLEENARQSSATLAKRLNVSSATVRRRIIKLIGNKSLRIVAAADTEKIGFPLIGGMALHLDPSQVHAALDSLSSKSEIRWLGATTGRYNIIALARFPSTDEFYSFIKKSISTLNGLHRMETFVCLNVRKGRWGARL